MTDPADLGPLFMLGFLGTSIDAEFAELSATYRPGGVIVFSRNLTDANQIVALTNDLQRRAAAAPLLIAIDQEGGRVSRLPNEFTIFPPCATVGRCGSADLAYQAAAATAKELRAVGINMNMAPVLDVHSNPANPIIGDRAFGTNPATVSALGLATIKGLQEHGVVACGKHFPGHGDTATDSHKELPRVEAPRERLERIELPPFRDAVAQGVASLMTAHVLYPALDPALPATLSPTILTGLLRERMGFDGVVFTDDLEMHAIIDHYGVGDAAVRAFLAGADILLVCKDYGRSVAAMEAIRSAVADGTIPAARVEASLRRIRRLKERFLAAGAPVDAARAREVVGHPAHRTLLDRIRDAGGRAPGAPV